MGDPFFRMSPGEETKGRDQKSDATSEQKQRLMKGHWAAFPTGACIMGTVLSCGSLTFHLTGTVGEALIEPSTESPIQSLVG